MNCQIQSIYVRRRHHLKNHNCMELLKTQKRSDVQNIMMLNFSKLTCFSHQITNGKNQSVASTSYRRRALERGQNIAFTEEDEERVERIRKLFGKIELSVSCYDTALVAMVPSRSRDNEQPSFPQCLDWILQNQKPNGSWGLHPATPPLLVQDSLSSTLACVLALQKWKTGQLLVEKGLDFIGSNSWAVSDKDQYSPIGFDIIFPGLINQATDLGLKLPLEPVLVDTMLRNRDQRIASGFEKRGHLAYVAEGLGKSYDWKEALTLHQRKNGSLFNSPSTTAAALIHSGDDKCFDYLSLLLEIYGNAVPTIYPLDTYTRLCLVDHLERLGIDRYFKHEIKNVLDETYRSWIGNDEEIFLDVACRAMSFRLLRMNGYKVGSECLEEFVEQEQFFTSASPQFTDTRTVLELYRASEITIFQHEPVLNKLHSWTSSFLKQQLHNQTIQGQRLHSEVEYALDCPNCHLERLDNRKNIELCHLENIQLLKTLYTCSNIDSIDIYELSVRDFNSCQLIYQEELACLERWMKESGLYQLKFGRLNLEVPYFLVVVVLFSPHLSNARFSWTKNVVLSTIVDDFFDFGGSREELINLITLVEMWSDPTVGYFSENVKILYSAIFNLINELSRDAYVVQQRCVKRHLIDLWLDMLKAMMREYEWAKGYKPMPKVEDYISNGILSTGMGVIILIALYFIGSQLTDQTVESSEYNSLRVHGGNVYRLVNDLKTFKRESALGELNSISLYVTQNQGKITEEEAEKKIRDIIETSRRESLRMLVNSSEESIVPRECKDLFWMTVKSVQFLYRSSDEFSSPRDLLKSVDTVIRNKIELQQYKSSIDQDIISDQK